MSRPVVAAVVGGAGCLCGGAGRVQLVAGQNPWTGAAVRRPCTTTVCPVCVYGATALVLPWLPDRRRVSDSINPDPDVESRISLAATAGPHATQPSGESQ